MPEQLPAGIRAEDGVYGIMKLACCVVGLLLLMAGCSPDPGPVSPVGEFKGKHGADFKLYKFLNPVSVETFLMLLHKNYGESNGILEAMKTQIGTDENARAFVDNSLQQQAAEMQRMEKFFRDMESMAANGGAVCQYEWSDGATRESGFMVLKGGEIIARAPWITQDIAKTKAAQK